MKDLKCWQNRDHILCPHCDYVIEDVWDYEFPFKDGHTTTIDCPKCENLIFVELAIEIKYSSSKTAFK